MGGRKKEKNRKYEYLKDEMVHEEGTTGFKEEMEYEEVREVREQLE